MIAALVAAPAAGAAPVSLSVWSGGHSSFESPRGAVLQPSGKGTIFVAPRKGGKSRKVGTFQPTAAQLVAIRKARRDVRGASRRLALPAGERALEPSGAGSVALTDR